jgi:hypothetical protein
MSVQAPARPHLQVLACTGMRKPAISPPQKSAQQNSTDVTHVRAHTCGHTRIPTCAYSHMQTAAHAVSHQSPCRTTYTCACTILQMNACMQYHTQPLTEVLAALLPHDPCHFTRQHLTHSTAELHTITRCGLKHLVHLRLRIQKQGIGHVIKGAASTECAHNTAQLITITRRGLKHLVHLQVWWVKKPGACHRGCDVGCGIHRFAQHGRTSHHHAVWPRAPYTPAVHSQKQDAEHVVKVASTECAHSTAELHTITRRGLTHLVHLQCRMQGQSRGYEVEVLASAIVFSTARCQLVHLLRLPLLSSFIM